MVSTQDRFVHCYTLTDDLIVSGQVVTPARPGPKPECSDAEIIAIVLVRHLLHRRSESGFLTEIRRDHAGLFPRLLHHSQFNRRARWLWGAFEQVRAAVACLVPADDWGQIDTSALPVKHPSAGGGRTPGAARTACAPGSGATRRTVSGSTGSGSRPAPTWAHVWCGPGGSCPRQSPSETWPLA